MTFYSLPFFLFIAVTVLVYYLVPLRFRWCVLLAASYVFYWVNSHWLALVLLATTAVTFFVGQALQKASDKGKAALKAAGQDLPAEQKKALKADNKRKCRRIMLLGVLIDLCTLLFLKYYNFFAENANTLLTFAGMRLPRLGLLLPLGISFYTLQAIAYLVDIYRGKIRADTNFGKFMLFLSFFPQIVQGPIARHGQLAAQLYEGHRFDYKNLTFGAQLMIWGLMKKLIIADRIAIPANEIFDHYTQYHGLLVFLGAAFYGIQVYSDFSGGMDIARGVSQMMGVELELNFKQPYHSTSIEDFWRRWHITLGGWMRDYVFYPLSLSKLFSRMGRQCRKIFGQYVGSRIPTFLSMFIVYFLVGFWHGANWKYIGYGIWNGIFISAGILLTDAYNKAREKCGIAADSASWHTFQIFRTFILVSLGRFFSRADTLPDAFAMFKQTADKIYDISFIVDGSLIKLGLDNANWILLGISLLVLFAVDRAHERGTHIREAIGEQNIVFRWIVYYGALFAVLIFGIWGPGYDAASFIYEQF